jgi:sulfoxide reductase heme-binding subunit YedZ
MSRPIVIALKAGVHLLCLAPFVWLVRFCTSPRVFLDADPVKFIIHFTGNWAIYILLASVFIAFLQKLTAKTSLPVQLYRVPLLYALLWATLHVSLYVCIYSGYDFIGTFADFHTGHPGALLAEWNAVFPVLVDDFRKRQFLEVGLFAWILLLVGYVSSHALFQSVLQRKKWQDFSPFMCGASIAAVIHLWCFLGGRGSASTGPCIDVSLGFLIILAFSSLY